LKDILISLGGIQDFESHWVAFEELDFHDVFEYFECHCVAFEDFNFHEVVFQKMKTIRWHHILDKTCFKS